MFYDAVTLLKIKIIDLAFPYCREECFLKVNLFSSQLKHNCGYDTVTAMNSEFIFTVTVSATQSLSSLVRLCRRKL